MRFPKASLTDVDINFAQEAKIRYIHELAQSHTSRFTQIDCANQEIGAISNPRLIQTGKNDSIATFLGIRGEFRMEISCKAVNVTFRPLDKCFLELPVYDKGEPRFIIPGSLILTSQGTPAGCGNYTNIYRDNEGYYFKATPRLIMENPDNQTLEIFDDDDGIYEEEIMKQYRNWLRSKFVYSDLMNMLKNQGIRTNKQMTTWEDNIPSLAPGSWGFDLPYKWTIIAILGAIGICYALAAYARCVNISAEQAPIIKKAAVILCIPCSEVVAANQQRNWRRNSADNQGFEEEMEM